MTETQAVQVWAWIVGHDEHGAPVLARSLAEGEERPAGVPESAWRAEQDVETWRAQILEELRAIDAASIRALREENAARIAALEARAEALRAILRRLP